MKVYTFNSLRTDSVLVSFLLYGVHPDHFTFGEVIIMVKSAAGLAHTSYSPEPPPLTNLCFVKSYYHAKSHASISKIDQVMATPLLCP